MVSGRPRLLCSPSTSTALYSCSLRNTAYCFSHQGAERPAGSDVVWHKDDGIPALLLGFKQPWDINHTEAPCLVSDESFNLVECPAEDSI